MVSRTAVMREPASPLRRMTGGGAIVSLVWSVYVEVVVWRRRGRRRRSQGCGVWCVIEQLKMFGSSSRGRTTGQGRAGFQGYIL